MSHQCVQRGQEVPSAARWKGKRGRKSWEWASGGKVWCARKLRVEDTAFQTGVTSDRSEVQNRGPALGLGDMHRQAL